jgi:hypothetical protein
MYFSKTTVVAFIGTLALASATPLVTERQNGVSCQTSSGSPKNKDVTDVINEVKGKGGKCGNSNSEASGEYYPTLATSLPTDEQFFKTRTNTPSRLHNTCDTKLGCHRDLWQSD